MKQRIVVVLPAPLGPKKPKISPFSTLKEMLSTAVNLPKVLVKLWTSMLFFIEILLSLIGARDKERY